MIYCVVDFAKSAAPSVGNVVVCSHVNPMTRVRSLWTIDQPIIDRCGEPMVGRGGPESPRRSTIAGAPCTCHRTLPSAALHRHRAKCQRTLFVGEECPDGTDPSVFAAIGDSVGEIATHTLV
ncbi:hypothetical protein J6590_039153 [Homalodisca vitripennis]|nr:hypothetical protein J6590_039153 [Homalodisca vitripennis]